MSVKAYVQALETIYTPSQKSFNLKLIATRKTLRIGTRRSPLALWQATTIQRKLRALGYDATLVPITSTGDRVLNKPIYAFGITGVFTKALDIAILKGQIDVAVHSMKDVPTQLAQGLVAAAVLERGATRDVLVHKGLHFLDEDDRATIATSSLRRKAQWLHRYPHHTIVNIRGNVESRLQKLKEQPWNGAIFAQAGLERIKRLPQDAWVLDWMLPAPAQGAILVIAKAEDTFSRRIFAALNHNPSAIITAVERQFLRTLEGGCKAPIAALAQLKDQSVHIEGALFSLDGSQKISVQKTIPLSKVEGAGQACAQDVLQKGGNQLIQQIKHENRTLY